MNIAIIGCGWLGIPLAKSLIIEGHTVYGGTRSQNKKEQLNAMGILPFLIANDGTIAQSPPAEIDVLIITTPPFDKEHPQNYLQYLTNIHHEFSGCKKTLYTSSIGIYPKKNGVYRENFVFLEREKQSILYQAEQCIIELSNSSLILRLAGLYGLDRHPVFSLAGKKNVANPLGVVNLVHLDDVIETIILGIKKEATGTYNVVNPHHPIRKEYYTYLFRTYDLSPIFFESENSINRIISSEKLSAELGFTPNRSLNDIGV